MAEKVVLTLTREQAQMVEDACELYARLRIGQFERIVEMMLDVCDAENYCERRDTAAALLQTVACVIFGRTAYGTPECKEDALHYRAWNIYAALRHCLAWHDNPKGGWGVCYDEPYPWGGEAVPECRVITEKD